MAISFGFITLGCMQIIICKFRLIKMFYKQLMNKNSLTNIVVTCYKKKLDMMKIGMVNPPVQPNFMWVVYNRSCMRGVS